MFNDIQASEYIPYVITLVILFLFYRWRLWTIFPLLDRRCFSKNRNGRNLSSEQQKAINVGIVNSEQSRYYCNNIETGIYKYYDIQRLSKYWGIDSALSVKSTLEWLSNDGHRHYFERVIKSYYGNGSDSEMDLVAQQKCIRYMCNLHEALPILQKEQLLEDINNFSELSVLAWDMGRLVTVARGCYSCGYITEQQAWEYIDFAYNQSKARYSSWKELIQGYVLGRAMWGGNNPTLLGIIAIAEDAITNPKSPCMNTNL